MSSEARRFRKKPVVIEARRFDARSTAESERLADWCGGKLCGIRMAPIDQFILIRTLEGEMRADPGDWIIRGVRGEHYPCKPDIFAATYEAVEAPNEQ